MILITLIFALVYVSMLTAYKLRLRGQNQNWSKDIAYQLISKEWFSTRRDTLRDLENFCWQRSETVTPPRGAENLATAGHAAKTIWELAGEGGEREDIRERLRRNFGGELIPLVNAYQECKAFHVPLPTSEVKESKIAGHKRAKSAATPRSGTT